MRSALVCLLLLLAAFARSSDIVILVHQREAGPIVPQSDYEHPNWVLWPKSINILQSNRLFSLPSGVDWQTGFLDDVFVIKPREARNTKAKKWEQRGWDKAIKSNLGELKVFAVAPESGKPSKEVLKTALIHLTQVPILGRNEPWPLTGLMVAEARGRNPWDEVAALTKRAGGRALVVEYPYLNTTMWTRIWLMGKGWPEGSPISNSTRVPGLLPARELMALIARPEESKWVEDVVPANRWLGFGHEVSPVALVFMAVASIYILGLGIYCALREQYSRIAIALIRILVIGPAALLLGGQLTAFDHPANWAIWHFAAILGMIILSWIFNRIALKWIHDVHPLWGEFVAGALVCGACDPVWSMFTNVLGPHRAPTSPEAFGALAAYLVGTMVLSPSKLMTKIPAILVIMISIASTRFSGWMNGLSIAGAVLGLVLVLLDTSTFKNSTKTWSLLYLTGFSIGLLCALWKPGLAYAPQGLVYTFAQVGKFNCAEQIAFLLSPVFISFCLVAIVAGIVGENFLGHQARRAMAFSPKPKAFFPVALCFLVAGVFVPLYLHAFLATALAGAVAVLFDAIRVP